VAVAAKSLLVGYLRDGERRIGSVDGAALFELGTIDEFYANLSAGLPRSAAQPVAANSVTAIPFVPTTARVFCLGVNYFDHGAEAKHAGVELPRRPAIFGRWASTLVVGGDTVPVPPNEPGLDWEGELAAVIGAKGFNLTEDEALDYVLGYTAFNDLSARKRQLKTSQPTIGKNADKSGPIGPVLVTSEAIGHAGKLRLTTHVNAELRQDGNTADMIFTLAQVIAYISDTVTLLPGDVIATGTPSGVGAAMTPPQYLTPGDVVEVEVENIGVLRSEIVAHD
jgi:2-keto-4-pentenoate hydratase/2-oxohepta-3-ene-1,7-dioic acid hydratase in catechol pathway